MKISVCGKGGSGKSAVVALLALQALARDFGVLVVDSDESNSGLFKMLGFEGPPAPLLELAGGKGKIKEKMNRSSVLRQEQIFVRDIPSGYLKQRNGLAQVCVGKILQALEGCACPMGVLNREFLKKLRLEENEIALIDMEAGIEHFGRGVDVAIDKIITVIEPSFESVNVARKIAALATSMGKEVVALLNKMPSAAIAQKLRSDVQRVNLEIIGTLPNDPLVFDACLQGRMIDRGEAWHAAGKVFEALRVEA